MTTLQPSAANRSTVFAPRPREPPVTRTFLFLREIGIVGEVLLCERVLGILVWI